MQLAVIGAGVAGLVAARALRQRRPELALAVFEKSRGLGGRVATRRREGFAFDHGAQNLRAPGAAVARLLTEQLDTSLLRAIELPVWVFDRAGAIAPGDPAQNAEPKWCYADGANRLGKLLAEGLDVRQSTRVERLARDGPGWRLLGAAGEPLGQARAVLLTAPGPQSAEMIARSALAEDLRQALLAELAPATYRRCISLALAYAGRVERPFYALVNADRAHPIVWLALEHAKAPERCPPGHSLLIAQMAPGWSEQHWDDPADALERAIAPLVAGLLGGELGAPLWSDAQRWRYALPAGRADFARLNGTGSGLYFAGDFTAELGRVHLAIESGWRAAELIVAELHS